MSPLPELDLARIRRFVEKRNEWAIYWRDRNLKFRLYDLVKPSSNVKALLDEINSDPTCIFWG